MSFLSIPFIIFQYINSFFPNKGLYFWGSFFRGEHLFAVLVFFIYVITRVGGGKFDKKEVLCWFAVMPFLFVTVSNVELVRGLSVFLLSITPLLVFFLLEKAKPAHKKLEGLYLFVVVQSIAISIIRYPEVLSFSFNAFARFESIFPDTGMVTSYFYSMMSLVFVGLSIKRHRKRFILLGLICFIFSVLGQSRTYVFSFVLSVLFLLVFMKKINRPKAVLGFGVLGFAVYFMFRNIDIFNRLLGTAYFLAEGPGFYGRNSYTGSLFVRIDLWRFVLGSFGGWNYLLFGHGIGSAAYLSEQYFGVKSHFHNDLLNLLYEVGLPGAILYYWTLVAIVRRIFNKSENYIVFVVAVLVFEIFSSIANTNIHVAYARSVFLLGLFLIASDSRAQGEKF